MTKWQVQHGIHSDSIWEGFAYADGSQLIAREVFDGHATRIVRAVNCFDELVAALEAAPIMFVDEASNKLMPGFIERYLVWLDQVHEVLKKVRE